MKVSKLKVSNSQNKYQILARAPGALQGDPFAFFNFLSVAKHQKIEWGPFGIFLEKKSQCRKKTERGDPLVSPGMVCYAEKREKPFWSSSLDQMIQFGTIKFRRTLRTILASSCGLKKSKKESL